MKLIRTKDKILLVIELSNEVSWDKEKPKHITYDVPDIGKITEPIYMPMFDEPTSNRKIIAENKIIGLLKDISESDCIPLVEQLGITNQHFKDYNLLAQSSFADYWIETAKDSLISLIQSEGFDTSKNILLIEKIKK